MSFWQTFKASLIAPSKLGKSVQTKGWKAFLYVLLLGIIMSLPMSHMITQSIHSITTDSEKIGQSLPDFKIQSDQLQTKNKGYIYQTNHIIFTFDPQNKRDTNEIKNDLNHNQIAIALQKNQFIMAMADNEIAKSFGIPNPVSATYKSIDMNGLSSTELKKMIQNNPFEAPIMMMSLIMCFISTIVNLLFELLITAFAATFYSKLSSLPLTFGQNFKLCIFCNTWAVIINAILQWFNPASMVAGMASLITLIFYFIAVQPMRKS